MVRRRKHESYKDGPRDVSRLKGCGILYRGKKGTVADVTLNKGHGFLIVKWESGRTETLNARKLPGTDVQFFEK